MSEPPTFPQIETEAGKLPADWELARLGDVASLASGGTPSKSRPEFWEGTIPWASPKDLKQPLLFDAEDHISEAGLMDGSRLVQAGSLFVVVRGMILARDFPVAMAMVPMAFNQDMKALIPGPRVDGRYLLYAFQFHKQSLLPEIGTSAHGTRRISTSAIENFTIPLPLLPEQRSVAQALDGVRKAKEATEKTIAAARQLKASLMRHMFTYGSVHVGEADRVALQDSEFGPIPSHWQWRRLGDLIGSGPQNGLYKPEAAYGSGTPIIRINDYANDGGIVTGAPRRARLSATESETYSLAKGDLLINRVNSLSHIGKVALVGDLLEPTVFESNMMRFRVRLDVATPEFIFLCLCSPSCRNALRGLAKRAVAQSSVNQGDVKSLAIPVPPLSEQVEITNILDVAEAKLQAESARSNALQALFSTLLHHLMTGKIRVGTFAPATPEEVTP